ncbi:hypothetical protein WR25_09151 [Diploscapter pachys]|uniref:BZIP domain-containing protein n=1 Tax=Diploscapter pachys TaxID=2018661 RepID=A0A2A2LIN7_9BILA|nr:hypothetical protein WR25_09151 [Diploscapter pachys]
MSQTVSDIEKRREKNRDATRRHRMKQLKEKEHFKEEVGRLSQENLQLKEELRHAKSKVSEPEKESYQITSDVRANKRRLETTRPIAIKRPYEIGLEGAPRMTPAPARTVHDPKPSSDFLFSSLPTSTVTTTSTSVVATPPCESRIEKPTSIAFDTAFSDSTSSTSNELITPSLTSVFMLSSTLQPMSKMVDGSALLNASTGYTPCDQNILCIVKSPTTALKSQQQKFMDLMSL